MPVTFKDYYHCFLLTPGIYYHHETCIFFSMHTLSFLHAIDCLYPSMSSVVFFFQYTPPSGSDNENCTCLSDFNLCSLLTGNINMYNVSFVSIRYGTSANLIQKCFCIKLLFKFSRLVIMFSLLMTTEFSF